VLHRLPEPRNNEQIGQNARTLSVLLTIHIQRSTLPSLRSGFALALPRIKIDSIICHNSIVRKIELPTWETNGIGLGRFGSVNRSSICVMSCLQHHASSLLLGLWDRKDPSIPTTSTPRNTIISFLLFILSDIPFVSSRLSPVSLSACFA
jgi:hypothetical protein